MYPNMADDDRDSCGQFPLPNYTEWAMRMEAKEGHIWRQKDYMLGMKDGRGELVYRSGGRNERVRVKLVAYPMGSKPQGRYHSQFGHGRHSEGRVKPQRVHDTGQ